MMAQEFDLMQSPRDPTVANYFLKSLFSGITGPIAWILIDKTGSNITDIATRNHNDLAAFQGGSAGERYHLTAAQVAGIGNLTGPITSVGLATSIASQTGTGTKFVVDNMPTLVTPNIGVATGASLSLSGTVSLPSTGSAATAGQLTLVGGTKSVSTSAATATSLIFFQRVTSGGTIGFATTYTVNAGVSFTVSSDSALDTSVYNWKIIESH